MAEQYMHPDSRRLRWEVVHSCTETALNILTRTRILLHGVRRSLLPFFAINKTKFFFAVDAWIDGNATGLLRLSVVFQLGRIPSIVSEHGVQKEPSIPICRSTFFLLGSEGSWCRNRNFRLKIHPSTLGFPTTAHR